MKKVLVVEDDENKCSQVLAFLAEEFPEIQPVVAHSLRSGIVAISEEDVTLVILDMTLPNFDQDIEEDGGIIHPLGGQEFLRKMKRARLAIPVIVLTQFESFGKGDERLDLDTLRASLKERFHGICVETIYYNSAVEAWKRQLQNAIERIVEEGSDESSTC